MWKLPRQIRREDHNKMWFWLSKPPKKVREMYNKCREPSRGDINKAFLFLTKLPNKVRENVQQVQRNKLNTWLIKNRLVRILIKHLPIRNATVGTQGWHMVCDLFIYLFIRSTKRNKRDCTETNKLHELIKDRLVAKLINHLLVTDF